MNIRTNNTFSYQLNINLYSFIYSLLKFSKRCAYVTYCNLHLKFGHRLNFISGFVYIIPLLYHIILTFARHWNQKKIYYIKLKKKIAFYKDFYEIIYSGV